MCRKKRNRGMALVEFSLLGVPMLFAWISVIEMARGMWNYHTLQYATKATGAYLAMHGSTCGIPPNSCSIKIKDLASYFRSQAIGIPATSVSLTFTSASGTTVNCNPVTDCSSNATLWPPNSPGSDPDNIPGKDVTLRSSYVFRSSLAMVTGGGSSHTVSFGTFNLVGYTRQPMVF